MPTAQFTVHTRMSPAEVLEVFTDFGPGRAERWPNVDEAHFTLHDRGPGWAEVTEGTSMGWERERYEWDTDAGTVSIDTLDSNLWGPGSGWRYRISPAADGADVHVRLTRVAKSWQGKVLATLIPVPGAPLLRRQFQGVLKNAGSQ
jgi:hypothetical protein